MDFLFLCEIPRREEQAIALMCAELRRRGYSADYLLPEEWTFQRYRGKVNMVILNGCSSRWSLCRSIYTSVGKVKKIACMKWEQINKKSQDAFGKHVGDNICKTARTAIYFAWGNRTKERLTYCGVKPNNIFVTGAVTLDFLNDKMKGYYLGRKELCNRYNLNVDSQIILYNSSFANVGLSPKIHKEYVKYWTEELQDLQEEFDASCQDEVLNWFERLINETKNKEIIYRPHPSEVMQQRLHDMANKYANFHVISDLSIQQWIKIADYVCTTSSTSLVEAVYANKSCTCLRPINMPDEFDLTIYEKVKVISDYSGFYDSISNMSNHLITTDDLEEHYSNKENQLVYLKICDCLESAMKDNKYNVEWDSADLRYCKLRCITLRIKGLLYSLRCSIHNAIKLCARNTIFLIPQKYFQLGGKMQRFRERAFCDSKKEKINHKEQMINKMYERIVDMKC